MLIMMMMIMIMTMMVMMIMMSQVICKAKLGPACRREHTFEDVKKNMGPKRQRRAGESAVEYKNGHAAQARAQTHRAQARAMFGQIWAPRAGESTFSKKVKKRDAPRAGESYICRRRGRRAQARARF